MNDYFKKGALQGQQVVAALRQAAEDYENGEIAEVQGVLFEIVDAITEWEEWQLRHEHVKKSK